MVFAKRHQDNEHCKGHVLQMRTGINPNSSGHGVLWGILYFLPFSLVLVLVSQVEKSLNKELEEYREGPAQVRTAPELLPIWLFSWGGFVFLWTHIMASLLLVSG